MNVKIKIHEIIKEYRVYVDQGDNSFYVNARILKRTGENTTLPYSYEIDHRTTMGGASGIYYKDGSSNSMEKTEEELFYYLSLFEMPGAKFEKNSAY